MKNPQDDVAKAMVAAATPVLAVIASIKLDEIEQWLRIVGLILAPTLAIMSYLAIRKAKKQDRPEPEKFKPFDSFSGD